MAGKDLSKFINEIRQIMKHASVLVLKTDATLKQMMDLDRFTVKNYVEKNFIDKITQEVDIEMKGKNRPKAVKDQDDEEFELPLWVLCDMIDINVEKQRIKDQAEAEAGNKTECDEVETGNKREGNDDVKNKRPRDFR